MAVLKTVYPCGDYKHVAAGSHYKRSNTAPTGSNIDNSSQYGGKVVATECSANYGSA